MSTILYSYNDPWREVPDPTWSGKYGKLQAFWLLFVLLRISPAYELARRMQLGPLTHDDHASLPRDFEDVLQTYERLGNVATVFFADWWRTRGLKVFGHPTQPEVRRAAVLISGSQMESYELNEVNAIREVDGWPDALLLSVPLGTPRAKLLKQFEAQLDDALGTYARAGLPLDLGNPPSRIAIQRTITEKLVDTLGAGVRLLYLRSQHSEQSLLEFAKLAIPHKAGAKAKSRVKSDRDDADNNLRTSANRDLKKFERIAENAARGIYPSEQPVSSAPYSKATYRAIGERLRTIRHLEARHFR
jgi:hypothetical protein